MKAPQSREELTPEHILYMLNTIEKRTRATLNGKTMTILEHDFNVIHRYAVAMAELWINSKDFDK